jgi:carbonic anhydrase
MASRLVVLAPFLLAACASAPAPAAPSSAAPHWSYDGDVGPSHWGALDPSFATCSSGTTQSPVDLPATPQGGGKAPATPTWSAVPLRVVNNGHTIQVDDAAPSSFVVDGTTYALKNFHFHSPSEHTVNGRSYDVEMHFVHKTPDGKIAVVALLFNHGRTNDVLAPLWSAMPSAPRGEPVMKSDTIDVQALLPKAPTFYRYDGSLTVPPCTEGVKWFVVVPDAAAPSELSDAQIAQLRAALHGASNRPIQPLGGRSITELAP